MITRDLRIVHVFRAPLGGLFRHVVDLASEQTARGHAVGVFFDADARDARVDRTLAGIPGGLALGIATTAIKRDPGPRDLLAFAHFRAWLGRTRPDVIHGHGSKGGLYARLSAWSAPPGAPIIAYTPHGGSFNHRLGTPMHWLYMTAERALARGTDLFLFESAFIAGRYDRYVGAPEGLRRLVLNGLKAEEFLPVAPDRDAADLLFVGELREAKGVDTLLEAFSRLPPGTRAAPRLALVGSGPDRDRFGELALRLGVGTRVDFLGPLPAREAFRRGRILVVPSRQESLPYVVLEAAAAGLPIVATDVGGIPEIFGPYRDRLGPPGDAADLARRIAMTLATPNERLAGQAEALKDRVAAHFSISAMADAALGGYHDALQRRRPSKIVAPAPSSPR